MMIINQWHVAQLNHVYYVWSVENWSNKNCGNQYKMKYVFHIENTLIIMIKYIPSIEINVTKNITKWGILLNKHQDETICNKETLSNTSNKDDAS